MIFWYVIKDLKKYNSSMITFRRQSSVSGEYYYDYGVKSIDEYPTRHGDIIIRVVFEYMSSFSLFEKLIDELI